MISEDIGMDDYVKISREWAERIKSYCEDQNRCEECLFVIQCQGSGENNPPWDWDIESMVIKSERI